MLQLSHNPGPTGLAGCLSGDFVIVLWVLRGSAGEQFGCENSSRNQTEGLDGQREGWRGLEGVWTDIM